MPLLLLLLCKVPVMFAVTGKFDINFSVTEYNCCYICCNWLKLLLLFLLLCKITATIAFTVKFAVTLAVTVKFSVTIAVTV